MTSHNSYQIGDATVTRVIDIAIDTFTLDRLLTNWDEKIPAVHPEWILPASMDSGGTRAVLSIHTWVIRDLERVILIDTAAGNDKDRPHAPYFEHLQTKYLENLAAIGVQPEDVDFVLTTHLHVDHVGWSTRLINGSWVPTFPNARYFFSKIEHDYYNDQVNHNERNRTSFQVQRDSVNPVIDAGLATLLEAGDTSPIPGFTLYPTAGHSPGHVSIVFRSQDEVAFFSGDIVHHPVQVFEPGLMSIFDADAEKATRARQWGLEFAAENGAILFSPHFSGTSAGRVIRHGGGYSWEFV